MRRLGGFGITLILMVIVWALFVTPNRYGKALAVSIRAVEGMSKVPGSAPPYATVEIDPIRNTVGSVWASEIASMRSDRPGAPTMSGIFAASRGPGAIMAMQPGFSVLHDKCTIRVSAQAFDFPGTPYSVLLSRIGSREDSFLVVLAHEMAHCYWQPGPVYENRMNKLKGDPEKLKKMTALMPLMLNIAESYGDAYSLIFTARISSSLYARAYQGILAFRGVKGVKSDIYNTMYAIKAGAEMAKFLPGKSNPLNANWDVTNRYVMSATLTGAFKWLIGQGVSREDALSDIAFVLEDQGIEFSPKSISDKEYLIVSDGVHTRSGAHNESILTDSGGSPISDFHQKKN